MNVEYNSQHTEFLKTSKRVWLYALKFIEAKNPKKIR